MRLLKYLKPSGLDDDTNKFRALNISLASKKDGAIDYTEMVKNVVRESDTYRGIIEDVDSLNKELRKFYKGKWYFKLSLDEGKDISTVMGRKNRKKLFKMFMDANDRFSDIKFRIERKLAEKYKNK